MGIAPMLKGNKIINVYEEVAGYYAMTVGHDASEKYIVTDETWNKLKKEGLEKVRNFAEKEGIRREISRTGLAEREAQELLRRYVLYAH